MKLFVDNKLNKLFGMVQLGAQVKYHENRRLKRFSARLKVYSQQNDELIGYSENLNINGMMIVSKNKIVDNQELQIWFGADKDEKRTERILISCYKVWHSFSDTDNRLYYAGLHFISPSEDTLDKIQTLIYELEN